ncbi:nuclear transport factor 2 family protein [Sinomonas sp. G460-2]|uniref:nuclear transport factor 2 family protein n=1 Tax=Sinomonas sp. G460-2 TaxID=3393464 RepID=UPI0039F149CC
MSLTALDYEHILQLHARYSHAIDFNDLEAFTSCFTADGAFVAPDVDHRGTEQLRRFAASVAAKDVGHVRHMLMTSLVDGDDTTARSFSFAFITRDYGPIAGRLQVPPSAVIAAGVYDDTLVKCEGEWRYAVRAFTWDGTREQLAHLEEARIPSHRSLRGAALALSDEDRWDIRQLLASFCHALDFEDIEGFVGCFQPTATLEYEFADGSTERIQGEDAIGAFAARSQGVRARARHLALNPVIEGTGYAAHVTSYCLMPMDYLYGFVRVDWPSPGRWAQLHNPTIGHSGIFHDEVIKVEGRWLFAGRRFVEDGRPDQHEKEILP